MVTERVKRGKLKTSSYGASVRSSPWRVFSQKLGRLMSCSMPRQAPKLATEGDKGRLLLSCDVCHGAGGIGYGMESPVLRGQRVQYFIDTMTEFREGERENDAYGRMRFIASQLTEDEIAELAVYYSMPRLPQD